MSKKILMHQHDEFGCGNYRAIQPVAHCFQDLNNNGYHLTVDKALQSEELHFDAYIFHRVPLETLSYFVDRLKSLGKKIVWEVDDDIYHIPNWMPTEEIGNNIWGFNKVLDLADEIWVSTEELKKNIGVRNKNIRVLPNLVDIHAFSPPQPAKEEIIRILWCGSRSRENDLQVLVRPLEELIKEYGQRLQIVFWGYIPTAMLEFYRKPGTMEALVQPKSDYAGCVWYLDSLPFKFYYDKLTAMRSYIALCPLTDCPFNHSKSNLKYLEMTMGGSPVIATDITPYQCIEHGKDGLLVPPDDENSWYETIKYIIENPELRDQLIINAREKVVKQFSWQSPKKQLWVDAFKGIV